MYNFKANKALCLHNFKLLGKQYLALEGPISTSSSGRGLIRDVGTDIGTDVETIIKQPLLYYTVPITAEGKLFLGYRRTGAARDKYRRRD